ncbi:helix-turn-helix domain-containing protein [Butyricicoccus sp.]|uniref:helix-turn-helix domain-containing protein n=1 Tax=Butyricicoccus sp. TaxID=2049021 RepID=UPI003F153B49
MSTPRPRTKNGEKNLIANQLVALRKQHKLSQRELAHQMQLAGYDIDKNVITRIETNQRYVTDIEVRGFAELFGVSYQQLMDGTE